MCTYMLERERHSLGQCGQLYSCNPVCIAMCSSRLRCCLKLFSQYVHCRLVVNLWAYSMWARNAVRELHVLEQCGQIVFVLSCVKRCNRRLCSFLSHTPHTGHSMAGDTTPWCSNRWRSNEGLNLNFCHKYHRHVDADPRVWTECAVSVDAHWQICEREDATWVRARWRDYKWHTHTHTPLFTNLTTVLQLIRVMLHHMIGQTTFAAEGSIAFGAWIIQHLANLGHLIVHRFYVRGQIILRVQRFIADGTPIKSVSF